MNLLTVLQTSKQASNIDPISTIDFSIELTVCSGYHINTLQAQFTNCTNYR